MMTFSYNHKNRIISRILPWRAWWWTLHNLRFRPHLSPPHRLTPAELFCEAGWISKTLFSYNVPDTFQYVIINSLLLKIILEVRFDFLTPPISPNTQMAKFSFSFQSLKTLPFSFLIFLCCLSFVCWEFLAQCLKNMLEIWARNMFHLPLTSHVS